MNIKYSYLPEENHVVEAVEPAVDHQELQADLATAEELPLLLRILLRAKTGVEEDAGGEGCVESYRGGVKKTQQRKKHVFSLK